jgi:hypothetical protein
MSVITRKKPESEVRGALIQRGDLAVVVVGCDKCAKTSKTGGSEQVRAWKQQLHTAMMFEEPAELVDAVEEGLCDPDAVAKRLAPLRGLTERIQLVVLARGAGLKCVYDALPRMHIVPGLNTRGPGVKDQLACLACADCQFVSGRCRMLEIVRLQPATLEASHGQRRQGR